MWPTHCLCCATLRYAVLRCAASRCAALRCAVLHSACHHCCPAQVGSSCSALSVNVAVMVGENMPQATLCSQQLYGLPATHCPYALGRKCTHGGFHVCRLLCTHYLLSCPSRNSCCQHYNLSRQALPHGLQTGLAVQQKWYVNGQNYSRTLDAWLQRHNGSKAEILHCLEVKFHLLVCLLG